MHFLLLLLVYLGLALENRDMLERSYQSEEAHRYLRVLIISVH